MPLQSSGNPQRKTPQRYSAEGFGVATIKTAEESTRRMDSINHDSSRKGLTMRAASSIRRSVSKSLEPVGVPRVDAVLLDRPNIAARLAACGDLLAYRAWRKGETSGMSRYVADRCGLHLLCPFCAERRSRRVLALYSGRCDVVIANSPLPLDAFLITFTVKNGPDLIERFEHLTKSLRSLIKRVSDGRASEFSAIVGGAYGIEVKRGSGSGLWHPHAHMVALVPSGHFFDYSALKAEWLRWTGDSDVLNVTRMRRDARGSYASALREVFKYTTSFKPGDMSPVERFVIHASLKGRRLFGNFGALRDPCADDLKTPGESARFSDPEFLQFRPELDAYSGLPADASIGYSVKGDQGIISARLPGVGVKRFYGVPDLIVGD